MTEQKTQMIGPFESDAQVDEFLSVLGLGDARAPDVVQDDGSIVLAIGDRALTVEAQPAINGVLITAFIARLAGPELDGIVHDLMALNARLHATGGLIFGLTAEEIVVASLIVAQPYVTPRNVAEAVEAVIESTDVWRNLIESTANSTREAFAAENDSGESSDSGPNTHFV